VNEGIEPKDLAPTEVHEKLVSASAKLILLRMMLPKLRERGHRILLFSQVCFIRVTRQADHSLNREQFKLVLDIVEDFLDGEGIKHLRLVRG
jgi:chromodomain-helicase-DNA-binding protein 4